MKNYTFIDYATQIYIILTSLFVLIGYNKLGSYWLLLFFIHFAVLITIHLLIKNQDKFKKGSLLEFLRLYYPIPLYIGFYRETGVLNQVFISGYLDPFFIRFEEQIFGFQPSFKFMESLPYLWVSEIFYISYFSYYLMIAGVGLWLFLKDKNQFQHFVSIVSFVFYCCFIIYIILPVVGPRIFYREVVEVELPQELTHFVVPVFPAAVQSGLFYKIMGIIYDCFEAPGAAFPSSHVAVALTTVYFSFKYLRQIRYLHLIIAILLCASTVYCRYHYLVDVIAGVITAIITVSIGNKLYFHFTKNQSHKSAIQI
ncbi:MAG TPA: phosphatase PAP2 family protein [Verrucomicrobiota bacterium]|nr:phosphatase PAP2 family protein [Verrucomicrobiota bacterium]